MKKKILILTLILLALFTIAGVSAGDVNDSVISGEDDSHIELTAMENNIDENQAVGENNIIDEEDNGTFTALQQKIDNAEDNSTIIFENNYTYDDEFMADGILINKNLTIDGKGYTINASRQSGIFNIAANNVVLKNINFINSCSDLGGAIICDYGNLTIENCNFTNNEVTFGERGGAITFEADSLTVTGSRFTGNTADEGSGDSGALFFYGNKLNITGSEFISNSAYSDGVMLVIGENVTISKSRFVNNKAESGIVAITANNTLIDECDFINNSAEIYSGVSNVGTMTINNSYFANNTAERSTRLIRNSMYSTAIISNCVFENNVGNEGNYSIDNNYGTIYLHNNTINTQYYEIYNYGGDIISQVTVNILDNETVYKHLNEKALVYVTFCDDNGNLIYIDGFQDFDLLVNNTKISYIYNDVNQQFEGNFTSDKIGSCPVTVTNVSLSNLTIKTGEINIVNITNDFSTLRQLIGSCNATLTLTKDYIYNPLTDCDLDSGILIIRNITIDGAGFTLNGNNQASIFYVDSNRVTIKNINFINGYYDGDGGGAIYWEGDNGYLFNCTFMNNSADDGGAVFVDNAYNLTIVNSKFIKNNATNGGAVYWLKGYGSITGSSFDMNSADEDGGAVYFRSNYGVINDSNFTNNRAHYNGAVYMNSAQGAVIDCVFEGNAATDSAGALGWVKRENGSIVNSRFINNSAPNGGAVYLNNGTSFFIIDSIFENNTATENGGAIFWDSGNEGKITESSFINNKAGEFGGAIYIHGGDETITYSQFTNNTAASGGAIYNMGEINVIGNTFANNSAGDSKNDIAGDGQVKYIVAFKIDVKNNVYGKTVEIIVTLISDGETINNGIVSTILNNVTYRGDAVNGVATIRIPNLNAGSYNLNMSYATNDSSYNNHTEEYNLIINRQNIEITAKNAVYVINYGGKYSITLRDSNGNAVAGEKVTFTLNGRNIASATAGTDGVATIELTAATLKVAKAGKRNLIITLTPSNYSAPAKTVTITVNKEKTKITAKKKTFKKSKKTKKYTITLKNSKGKAVKKVRVTLKVKGKTYKAKTNANGKATFKIKKLTKKGKYSATVRYAGNAYYKAAGKKVKITVK